MELYLSSAPADVPIPTLPETLGIVSSLLFFNLITNSVISN